jgi:hypothetical protein
MIGDNSIDLTQENNFGTVREELTPFEIVRRRAIQFPWNVHRIEPGQFMADTRPKRLYRDQLSDDMGMLVRRTSDNKWFFGDQKQLEKPWFWEAFLEQLSEMCLIRTCWLPCPHCGTYHIQNKQYIYDECDECILDRKLEETYKKLFEKSPAREYIPWKDFNIQRILDNKQNWINIPTTAQDVLENIRKFS